MFVPNELSPPQWIRDQWSLNPKANDILFPTADERKDVAVAERGPAWANAGLHIQDEADDYAYVSGYRRAAQVLAEASLKTIFQKNILVYPILYLYQHTVELHLKRIIPMTAKLAEQPLSNYDTARLKQTHKLVKLWNMFKPRLIAMRKNEQYPIGDELLAGVEAYIRQLDEVGDQSFRYATAKDGNPALADCRHINLVRITGLMERLSSCFENFDETIRSL
jgi:hypothetical protein